MHELNIIGYEFNSKLEAKQIYAVNLPNLRPHNSNSIIIQGKQNIALLTAYDPDGKESNSYALFVDISSGKLLKKIPFKGIPKFAMPIIIDSEILIPTNDNGLVQLNFKSK